MRLKLILTTLLLFILVICPAYSLLITDSDCTDDGSLRLVFKADDDGYELTTDEMVISQQGEIADGTWDKPYFYSHGSSRRRYATFTSKENFFVNNGTQEVDIDYLLLSNTANLNSGIREEFFGTLSFNVTCPGLYYTCERLNLSIISCETKDYLFETRLRFGGINQSERGFMDPIKVIDYIFETEKPYLDILGRTSEKGGIHKNYTLKNEKGETYLISFPLDNNSVKNMKIVYNNNIRKGCNVDDYPNISLNTKSECGFTISAALRERAKSLVANESSNETIVEQPIFDAPTNSGANTEEKGFFGRVFGWMFGWMGFGN